MDLMGGLCEELVGEILDRIPRPIKPVIRMKCLSKRWHDLITRYRKSRSLTSASTLPCQYEFGHGNTHRMIFLKAMEDDKMQQVSLHKALGFCINSEIKVMESSNGFLLFSQYVQPLKLVVYVCNPAQKQWEWDALPPLFEVENYKQSVYVNMGLSYDGVPDHPYKVLCYSLLDFELLKWNCHIYSSDTRQWQYHSLAVTGPCEGVTRNNWMLGNDGDIRNPHLFWNGKMLCVTNDYMLECHFPKTTFKLVKLPSRNQFRNKGILFVSEGCLHYCDGGKEGIWIWKYVRLEITPNDNWKLMQEIEITKIIAQHPEIHGTNWIKPCGFDEELQVLYIQLPKAIFCYSLETQTFNRAWTFEDVPEKTNTMFHEYRCYRYCVLQSPSSSRYHIRDDCILSLPEAEPQGPPLMI